MSSRPYGGVGFLWNKSLDASISPTKSDYDWLCCIKIRGGKKEYFLINVYLPFVSDENGDNFNDCLAKLNVFTESINGICVTVLGNFNFTELLH